MGLNRRIIAKKINLFSIEDNKDELIKLLCDILEDENANEYYDLILMIIDIAELYGYYKYFENKEILGIDFDFKSFANLLRKDLYKSNYNQNLYFNSGQLSLLSDIESEDKVFISAPTSFGKTSLIFEHIINNKDRYESIVFLAPTNALVEELYLKFLMVNKQMSLDYKILTTPLECDERCIWILTPEKYLLLLEVNSCNFDLIIMDESYKIDDDDQTIDDDILNSRSSKYRRVMEYMGMSSAKCIFLSPYTYRKQDSMKRFFDKYNIKCFDRTINYVQKNIVDVSNSHNYKLAFGNSGNKIKKSYSGVDKALAILPELTGNTIIYVMYPKEALKILEKIDDKSHIDIINQNDLFLKFYNHLKETYLFDDSNWYIIDALEKGIGIYVSPIPRYIKREIINLFNLGLLDKLIVTTAFAEGVNSSAKNIIITNRTAANKKLTNLDLLNLSGRAGRFGVYSKGYVYSAVEDVTDILYEASETGVSISNQNYNLFADKETHSDYDIDIMDKALLNDAESENRRLTVEKQNNYNLSNEDLSVALSVSNSVKLDLYEYFEEFIDEKDSLNEKFDNIKNLMSSERGMVIDSLNYIFDDLRKAKIPVVSSIGDINPYNKYGEFIWGTFYGIHSSGDIKSILKNRKKYINDELNAYVNRTKVSLKNKKSREVELLLDIYGKKWIAEYLTNGEIDNFKLYNGAFKFISNIIEYRIPFYVGFYISIFKLFSKKNNLSYNFDFSVVDVSSSLENKVIDDKYLSMLEFGIPLDTIKKIEKTQDDDNILLNLDEYEKIMVNEYLNYYNS